MSAANSTSLQDCAPGENPLELSPATPCCGIIAVDTDGRIAEADPHVARLLGFSGGSLAGESYRRLPLPLTEVLAGSLAGESAREAEIQIDRPGAGQLRLFVIVRTVKAGNGCPLVIATLLDVTALREIEANTHRLERLASIGTLSAGMAHEIKNALVAVRTFTELLAGANSGHELAALATCEVRRIDSIVSQMLRFGGLGKPTYLSVALNEAVAHAARLIQHQLGEKRIVLRQKLAAQPDRVRGDGYQLHQVLLNLFLNAIDAMPAGGELAVASESIPLASVDLSSALGGQGCVRVTVSDTGAGVAPEHLEKMFDPFFTTKPAGTGLGLPIVRRIVKEHGGTITVESQMDRGTTFTLLFPAAAGAR